MLVLSRRERLGRASMNSGAVGRRAGLAGARVERALGSVLGFAEAREVERLELGRRSVSSRAVRAVKDTVPVVGGGYMRVGVEETSRAECFVASRRRRRRARRRLVRGARHKGSSCAHRRRQRWGRRPRRCCCRKARRVEDERRDAKTKRPEAPMVLRRLGRSRLIRLLEQQRCAHANRADARKQDRPDAAVNSSGPEQRPHP